MIDSVGTLVRAFKKSKGKNVMWQRKQELGYVHYG